MCKPHYGNQDFPIGPYGLVLYLEIIIKKTSFGDVSILSFGSHLNPIPTRGEVRLCPIKKFSIAFNKQVKWVNKGELAVGRRREDAAAGGYMWHKSFSLELLAIISPCSTCWVAPLTFLLSVLGQGFCSFGVFGYKILLVFEVP